MSSPVLARGVRTDQRTGPCQHSRHRLLIRIGSVANQGALVTPVARICCLRRRIVALPGNGRPRTRYGYGQCTDHRETPARDAGPDRKDPEVADSSFDIVSKIDRQEVDNALKLMCSTNRVSTKAAIFCKSPALSAGSLRTVSNMSLDNRCMNTSGASCARAEVCTAMAMPKRQAHFNEKVATRRIKECVVRMVLQV